MSLKTTALLLLTLCVCFLRRADASYAPRTSMRDQGCIVVQISDLRSAYLQRAGIVRYDESNRTADGLRKQLQQHFDVVLTLLSLATPSSIETAAARLEAADDHVWSDQERAASRHILLMARGVQLQRLAAYRDRGSFPLNEGQSAHPAPIFVDRHGTACAVGHLMRCSGWSDAVDAIRKSNNLVYVPDAPHSEIAAWVMTSGLTFEEAALIQPGYYWPLAPYDASNYEPGQSALDKDGLRFSNFKLQAQNYTILPTHAIVPTNTGNTPTISGLGLATAKGDIHTPGFYDYPSHITNGTNWMAIGGSNSNVQSPRHSLNASAAVGKGQMVLISFDVAATASDQLIDRISETDDSYWQGFQSSDGDYPPPASTVYSLQTTASDGATTLALLNSDQTRRGSYTQTFAARQQLSVEAGIWLQDGVKLNTFMLDFNLVNVPEPTLGFLAATLLFAMSALRKAHHSIHPSERSTARFHRL